MSNTTDPDELTKGLVEYYLNNFYGYGTWNSKYWFVGLEEAVGKPMIAGTDTLLTPICLFKFKANQLYKISPPPEDLLDSKSFHGKLYEEYYEIPNGKTISPPQETHKPFIQCLQYVSKGIEIHDPADIKRLQAGELGRHNTNELPKHCLIELLPFPSQSRNITSILENSFAFLKEIGISTETKNNKEFIYKSSYIQFCMENKYFRAGFIRTKLAICKPSMVLFYDFEMIKYINIIVGVNDNDWVPIPIGEIDQYASKTSKVIIRKKIFNLLYCRKGDTAFFITEHPARNNSSSCYWKMVLPFIRKLTPTTPSHI